MNSIYNLGLLVALFSLLSGCGSPSPSDGGSANAANPSNTLPGASPNGSGPAVSTSTATLAPPSVASAGNPNMTPQDGTSDSKGASSDGKGVCLTDCNPPQEILVTFDQPTSFAPAGCTVNDAVGFPSNTGITSFMIANCAGKTQLYSLSLSVSGAQTGQLTQASTSCSAAGDQALRLAVDQGASGFAVAFLCAHALGTFQTGLTFLNAQGQVIKSFLMPTSYSSASNAPSAFLSWNSVAGVHGLEIGGSFQRYNEQGSQLGGTVSVPSTATIIGMSSAQGVWNIIQGSTSLSWGGTNFCSKISQAGTLECDRLTLADNSNGIVSPAPSDSAISGVDSGGHIGIAGFNPLTCSLTTQMTKTSLVDSSVKRFFGSISFGSRYMTEIYSSDGFSVNAAFLDTSSGNVLSTSGIVDGSQINRVTAFSMSQKLYIVVAKDNDAILIVSDQTIPQ